MTVLDRLPHQATAKRRSLTQDPYGGTSSHWEVLWTKECWLQPVSAKETNEYDKRGVVVEAKVYFAEDPGLTEQDVLEIGGKSYEVVAVSDPDRSVGMGLVWRVMVVRTTTGSTPEGGT